MLAGFRSPADAFRPTPFYWWAGEPLEHERIEWQLDRLREKGIRQVIVSYPHGRDGRTDIGVPPLFSAEWWRFFRWFLSQCRERGMAAGIQDYTFVGPALQEIGAATPGMRGGRMHCASTIASQTGVVLKIEHSCIALGAWAFPILGGIPQPEASLDLSEQIKMGRLCWSPPTGKWLVALVMLRPSPFDPLHPQAGRLAINRLYEPFERECPGEVGRTLKIFFQDELEFGSSMPFWSEHLREAFRKEHRYDIWPLLPGLWVSLGPWTTKIRLDYADTVARQLERCYFEPVYRWHEARGTLFGHDNCGRGEMRVGQRHYGDYFRAMRWYSAPGCDDPKVQGERAFKGLKTNSSIAHLYQRPRVWVEAFHSSGWGTRPAEVIAALNQDFAFGATLVNLHGLYYTTRGGWWEWAPPDFHFRQPYWEHSLPLNDYLSRISWLLSQGVHRCDVAILYPSAAIEAEGAETIGPAPEAHIGHTRICDEEIVNHDPERVASGIAKYLFDRACDFDFVDYESLDRARATGSGIEVSGEIFRVLVLPAMRVIRMSTLEAAWKLVQAGGLVIACGCLPEETELVDQGQRLAKLRSDIFSATPHASGGRGVFIERSYARACSLIDQLVDRDVRSAAGPLHVLHRRKDAHDIYYLFNPSSEPLDTEVTFRLHGKVEEWDAWTGAARPLNAEQTSEGRSKIRFQLAAHEAKIAVFDKSVATSANTGNRKPQAEFRGANTALPEVLKELSGDWSFEVRPTLDNRFGDFRLPAVTELIGPEARRFRWADETAESKYWHSSEFDDSAWPETTYSFGPRFEVAGPLPQGSPAQGDWKHYEFSLQWGIERDPHLTNWLSGPHGLKGKVPDEYIDLHCEQPGSEWHLRSVVMSDKRQDVALHVGSRCAYTVWLNDQLVFEQPVSLAPGAYAPWNIPHYECLPQKATVSLHAGRNALRLKLVQPSGQRTRAFIAFDPPEPDPSRLGLRWFANPQTPRPSLPAAPSRRAVWLRTHAPPGFKSMDFTARGPTRVWVDGFELSVQKLQVMPDGSLRFRALAGRSRLKVALIAIRVEAPPEFRAGDVLTEPVRFECGEGEIPLGDWCKYGLGNYSGIGEYKKSFELESLPAESRILLDFGDLVATAEVWLNGVRAGTLCSPPWKMDVTEFVLPGTNTLAVRVANTLANHYQVGIPTPYAFAHQTKSGIFGPVRLMRDAAGAGPCGARAPLAL